MKIGAALVGLFILAALFFLIRGYDVRTISYIAD